MPERACSYRRMLIEIDPILDLVGPMPYCSRVQRRLSLRLLSILQLTRMALVFTAISNSICATLLLAKFTGDQQHLPYTNFVQPARMAAVVIMSIGLYGFGMSLNDIIDRRRDQQIAPLRPLPSGRIG